MTDRDALLVAAYCRVSTDRADQANSLRSQREYFHTYIKGHPGWQLAQVYADEGLSGTSIRRRAAFQQMMEDAEEGKFGLILTKEVSRFARNTVDTLAYTRRLKALGVGVVFLSDNIDTRDNDGELRLTIMASIAQEESRKTSQRVKWGQRRRMEAGVVFGSDSAYGFETRGGVLTVRPEEARVVRLIYHKYLYEGKGVHVIARELNQAGIAPPKAERWSENTLLRILRNEKYVGDLRQRKYVTVDYLTHRKIENRNMEEQIYLRDHHQAIVDRETWEKVQQEMDRRRAVQQRGTRYSARCWASGQVKCGGCGGLYIPRTSRRKGGTAYKSWGCRNSCGMGMVNDKTLLACGQFALERMGVELEEELTELAGRLEQIRRAEERLSARRENKLREVERRLRRALEGYLEGVITAEELKNVRMQYKIESERTVEREKSSEVFIPGATRELWEDILWETKARVTVFSDSLEFQFCGQRKGIVIWYITEGRGEQYKTVFQRWEVREK
ncbi:recombinase family protein [uncultured Pseudoflavonifractor sp.]|uniref:recombinase family protein n=1 Tax=uncultured Pseudoflavonifractor sp. TaxID=1221379 RepID=UPI0025FE3C27|nr:recombinase family protein [uncultured Pseudoflavonifractor sp.]